MTTMYDTVALFHEKFGLPVAESAGGQQPVGFASKADMQYRLDFLREELNEFTVALARDNLPDAADALMDLMWVCLGTCHYMGLPVQELWQEVARANMAKVLAKVEDPLHKRGPREIIRKPLGWRAPDIDGILHTHMQASGEAPK